MTEQDEKDINEFLEMCFKTNPIFRKKIKELEK